GHPGLATIEADARQRHRARTLAPVPPAAALRAPRAAHGEPCLQRRAGVLRAGRLLSFLPAAGVGHRRPPALVGGRDGDPRDLARVLSRGPGIPAAKPGGLDRTAPERVDARERAVDRD